MARVSRLRSRQKKLKAYDLSTLSEFLPSVSDASQRWPLHEKNLKLNHKSRQKLVEKESNQLRAVLNHPVFQSDPLSAIHQHLASTQPLPVSSQEKRSGKMDKKKKRKRSKVSSGGQLKET
ncbi:uncharacterized protein LOC131229855 [Magnolia sinica]|uniref:uncharacterized protein LOC131229855 n=1 Tax=Magnolia sinica TaxID=86752 RepID=UPI002658464B|nr:uncharacterized protein LOC131229855 [Magnolia sinica]